MADIAKHALVGVSVEGSAIGAVEPGNIRISPAVQTLLERGGELHPQIGLTLTGEPMIEFQTTQIDLVSAAGAISQDFVLYFRAFSDGAGYGSGYVSLTVASGLIVPVSLAASAKQKALLTVQVHPISSDGDTAPVQVGSSSGVLTAVDEVWTVGDADVGGALAGVQDASLDWGYNVAKNAGENGKVFPTEAYIDGQEARLSITTAQLSAAAQALLNFGKAETSVVQEFRKLAAGGAPTTSYSVTVAKALVTAENVGNRPATVQLNCAAVENSGYLQFA